MKSVLRCTTGNALRLPEAFEGDDVRFSDDFAARMIEGYTREGDLVLDPFAGFGTTLYAATRLGRRGVGVEFLPERAAYMRSAILGADVRQGSALALSDLHLPPVDFSLTSPPYMTRFDHEEYPFAGYEVTAKGYDDYLEDIREVYRQMRGVLRPGARAAIEVANLPVGRRFTQLAWDVAASVGRVMRLEHELIVHWLGGGSGHSMPFGCDHSYCLIFINDDP